jgi:hypothetical protein
VTIDRPIRALRKFSIRRHPTDQPTPGAICGRRGQTPRKPVSPGAARYCSTVHHTTGLFCSSSRPVRTTRRPDPSRTTTGSEDSGWNNQGSDSSAHTLDSPAPCLLPQVARPNLLGPFHIFARDDEYRHDARTAAAALHDSISFTRDEEHQRYRTQVRPL